MYSNIHPFFQFQILAVSLIGALTDPPSDPKPPPRPLPTSATLLMYEISKFIIIHVSL